MKGSDDLEYLIHNLKLSEMNQNKKKKKKTKGKKKKDKTKKPKKPKTKKPKKPKTKKPKKPKTKKRCSTQSGMRNMGNNPRGTRTEVITRQQGSPQRLRQGIVFRPSEHNNDGQRRALMMQQGPQQRRQRPQQFVLPRRTHQPTPAERDIERLRNSLLEEERRNTEKQMRLEMQRKSLERRRQQLDQRLEAEIDRELSDLTPSGFMGGMANSLYDYGSKGVGMIKDYMSTPNKTEEEELEEELERELDSQIELAQRKTPQDIKKLRVRDKQQGADLKRQMEMEMERKVAISKQDEEDEYEDEYEDEDDEEDEEEPEPEPRRPRIRRRNAPTVELRDDAERFTGKRLPELEEGLRKDEPFIPGVMGGGGNKKLTKKKEKKKKKQKKQKKKKQKKIQSGTINKSSEERKLLAKKQGLTGIRGLNDSLDMDVMGLIGKHLPSAQKKNITGVHRRVQQEKAYKEILRVTQNIFDWMRNASKPEKMIFSPYSGKYPKEMDRLYPYFDYTIDRLEKDKDYSPAQKKEIITQLKKWSKIYDEEQREQRMMRMEGL